MCCGLLFFKIYKHELVYISNSWFTCHTHTPRYICILHVTYIKSDLFSELTAGLTKLYLSQYYCGDSELMDDEDRARRVTSLNVIINRGL